MLKEREDAGTTPLGITMVQTLSAEEAVTTALREAILNGHLAPGQRLTQADLAKRLGVSRIPLRDALRRLNEEQLVKMDGRRGAWVTALTPLDIAEMYEMRMMLEPQCVRYAVLNLHGDDTRHILELSTQMDELGHDPAAGLAARRNFYAELYSHANRPHMRRLIIQLRDNVGRYHLIENIDHSHEAHAELRRCIRAADADGAAAIVTSHLQEARDDLLARMVEELAEDLTGKPLEE